RAMYQFVTIELRGNQIQWDKTKHVVPEAMKIAMQTMRTSAAPAGVIGVAPGATLTLPVPAQAAPLRAAAPTVVEEVEVPAIETSVLWPLPAVAAAIEEEAVLWPRPAADETPSDEEKTLWPPQAAPAGDGASRDVEPAKVLWPPQAADPTTPSGDGHARDIVPASVLSHAPQLADAQHSEDAILWPLASEVQDDAPNALWPRGATSAAPIPPPLPQGDGMSRRPTLATSLPFAEILPPSVQGDGAPRPALRPRRRAHAPRVPVASIAVSVADPTQASPQVS
ncbi:MAG: hypothetical protein AAGJ10_21015, partial [Bacteroidota bacterium]